MNEEVKREIIERLMNNDTYQGCITDVLNSLRILQEEFEELSTEYRTLFNIIDTLEEYENGELDLLDIRDVLLTFVERVENNYFLPIITDRDVVIVTLLNK